MKLPADRTAIVLIEPQHDFLSPGGTMYQYIAEQLAKTGRHQQLKTLLDSAPRQGKDHLCPLSGF